MMKQGAFLLNVSRGGLVNSEELINALERGQIGGIGLDVWENEGEPRTKRQPSICHLLCNLVICSV